MTLSFEQLKRYRKKVAMVDGAFDPLHHGHVRYIHAARQWLDAHGHTGVPLFCNLASDDYLRTKHEPFLEGPERAEVIEALRHINYTHLSESDTEIVLRELQPTHYIKGREWQRQGLPPEQVRVCGECNIVIVFCGDHVASSTERLLRIARRYEPIC